MSQVLDDSHKAGREAARKHAWREAYDLLQLADADEPLGAEHLELLAESAGGLGGLRKRSISASARMRPTWRPTSRGEPRSWQ